MLNIREIYLGILLIPTLHCLFIIMGDSVLDVEGTVSYLVDGNLNALFGLSLFTLVSKFIFPGWSMRACVFCLSGSGIFILVFLFLETAAAAFVYIFYTLSATRVLNSFEELCITLAAPESSTPMGEHIYIYIFVIHRQTVSFHQNSSVWLDTQDARSRDRNPSNFTKTQTSRPISRPRWLREFFKVFI